MLNPAPARPDSQPLLVHDIHGILFNVLGILVDTHVSQKLKDKRLNNKSSS